MGNRDYRESSDGAAIRSHLSSKLIPICALYFFHQEAIPYSAAGYITVLLNLKLWYVYMYLFFN